jgi:phosphatidate cytidylyltransferase
MFLVFIQVLMLLAVPARMALIGETTGFLRAAGMVHWGLMPQFQCQPRRLRCSCRQRSIRTAAAPRSSSTSSTEANDIAQFVWGKSLGRLRVVPQVSPNKTWAGLIGGVATTVLLGAWIAPWLTPMTRLFAAAAGFGIGASGFIGDIVVSALKRDLGLKDCSTMLPGHGGILDRIDSLTYTAPLFFHFVHFMYGGGQ